MVADGYGLRIAVERGHLVINDGYGRHRHQRRLAKIGHGIRRLIILGHSGTVSLDAMRWLDRVGIYVVHIDPDGAVLATSAHEGPGDARLRRAQATAWGTPVGLDIVTGLLRTKIAGQANNVRHHLGDTSSADRIDNYRQRLATASDMATARELEASAALDYFTAWTGRVGLRWVSRDRDRVPDHWHGFDGRRSLLTTSGNRRATQPINAVLNYLYTLGEIECRRACLILGLDPGLGFLHHDAIYRDSLALDLLEAIRPDIDAYAIQLSEAQLFAARDFVEVNNGQCRLAAPMTHQLAETTMQWQRAIAPHAEHVAHRLADTSLHQIAKTRPLTNEARKAASSAHSARRRKTPAATEPAGHSQPPSAKAARRCVDCGGPLTPSARLYCATCLVGHRQTARARGVQLAAAMVTTDAGRFDRGQAVSAGRKRSSDRAALAVGLDADDWLGLAPRVSRLSLATIMHTTGLGITQASRIKSGKYRPPARHWHALAAAAAVH